MNQMKYKGYVTKIDYSEEDDVLFGLLLGIKDSVSFDGKSIQEFRKAFHEAVDDYLDICNRYNKKPEVPSN